MPRAAGNSTHYEFVLSRGRTYDKDVTIRLPSITHCIGSTIAKPELMNWSARVTRDGIVGMVSVVAELIRPDYSDLFDVLTDEDMLKEYLKENGLDYESVRDEAASRGTREHLMLEVLADAFLDSGEEAAETVARRTLGRSGTSPWAKGICQWWLDEWPTVVAAEKVMYSLRLGVAGTCDLVLRDQDGGLVVVDLKTRVDDRSAYRTDFIQVDGYRDMYEEMTGEIVDRTAVLVVEETSGATWYDNPLPRGVFEQTKALYDSLKGVR